MSKAKLGRPPLKIDPEQVRSLAAIQCTMIEMGYVLNCSVDHLERHFADIIKEGRTQGVMSVKRKLYEKAIAGDNTMIIWFTKNFCGMRDRHDVNSMSTQVTVVETKNIDDTRATVRSEIQAMLDDLKSCPTQSFPLLPASLPQ